MIFHIRKPRIICHNFRFSFPVHRNLKTTENNLFYSGDGWLVMICYACLTSDSRHIAILIAIRRGRRWRWFGFLFLDNSSQNGIVIAPIRTFATSIDFDINQFSHGNNWDSGIQHNPKMSFVKHSKNIINQIFLGQLTRKPYLFPAPRSISLWTFSPYLNSFFVTKFK